MLQILRHLVVRTSKWEDIRIKYVVRLSYFQTGINGSRL
jgi:hypothetical protein